VVVILEDNPSSWACCSGHLSDDRRGIGDVLEQEAGVHHVERSPLVCAKGWIQDISFSELGEVDFPVCRRLAEGLGDLLLASLDSDHVPGRTGPPSDRASQLTKAAAEIQNALSADQAKLAQNGFVEQVVQPRQAALFILCYAMKVTRFSHPIPLCLTTRQSSSPMLFDRESR
jgi:hypothetical protein